MVNVKHDLMEDIRYWEKIIMTVDQDIPCPLVKLLTNMMIAKKQELIDARQQARSLNEEE